MGTASVSQLTQYVINTAASYSINARPTIQTAVQVMFLLVKTLQLSPAGILELAGELILSWKDPRLAWNRSDFGNLTKINVPSNAVWTPGMILLNAASDNFLVSSNGGLNLLISSTGSVKWIVPQYTRTSCSLDLLRFPFDQQTCNLAYVTNELVDGTLPAIYFDADPKAKPPVALDVYVDTGEFRLITASLNTSGDQSSVCVQKYCFPGFTIELSYVRRSTYYMYNLIIPAFVLTMLVPFAFLIPSESNVKVTTTCSLMIALYVLQQNVSRLLPASANYTYCSMASIASLIIGCVAVIGAIVGIALRITMPTIPACCIKILLKSCGRKVTPDAEKFAFKFPSASLANLQNLEPELSLKTADDNASETRSEELQLMRKMAALLDRLVTLQQADAHRSGQSNEKTFYWKKLDLLLNCAMFLGLTLAALLTMLFLGLQY